MMKFENSWIEDYLSNLYYDEVYSLSDEYIEEQCERAEAEAEFYAEHLDLLEEVDESEEEQLHTKINGAIWVGDAKTIIEFFSKESQRQ